MITMYYKLKKGWFGRYYLVVVEQVHEYEWSERNPTDQEVEHLKIEIMNESDAIYV